MEPDARSLIKYAVLASVLSLGGFGLAALSAGTEKKPGWLGVPGGPWSASMLAIFVTAILLVYLLSWMQLVQGWSRRSTTANVVLLAFLTLTNLLGSLILWIADPWLIRPRTAT